MDCPRFIRRAVYIFYLSHRWKNRTWQANLRELRAIDPAFADDVASLVAKLECPNHKIRVAADPPAKIRVAADPPAKIRVAPDPAFDTRFSIELHLHEKLLFDVPQVPLKRKRLP